MTRRPDFSAEAPSPSAMAQVREAFLAADFTIDGVAQRLGPSATAALERDQVVPARRALTDLDPLGVLIRLHLLGDAVPVEAAASTGVDLVPLAELGLVHRDADQWSPTVRVQPYDVEGRQDRWLVSDHLHQRPLPDDHVLGLGGAAATLAQLIVGEQVDRALDLGTGCGIQLLHLAEHVNHAIGTDVNPRALALARLTLGLSQVEADLLHGDRFAPLGDRRVDLVVSNPPVVIGPSSRFAYRDSGLQGDAMSAAIVTGSVNHLTEGGWCQLLANWLHVNGQDWRERVGGWLPDGVDAWIVQREVLDPPRYVEMWLADGGDVGTDAYREHYDEWLGWFDEQGIEAVGMGWITLRRTDAMRHVQLEDVRQPVEHPMGRTVVETFQTWAWADATSDAALLDAPLRVPDHVELRRLATSTVDGWHPNRPVLVQHRRMRREAPTDEFGAVLVGLLDGERSVGEAVVQAAGALSLPVSEDLLEGTADAVRGLLEQGFLAPPGS